ncbi:hypothetical protein DBR32_02505 [Taibaiella sp. KBW10]|uniref:hypothetical protein n=1 Tax=Taibaiella sp. KBW10 TaxID=2153357 RepID=UPI000F59860D|nr:hypothetical protein [Taibaiella sp. KBW10]RQO32492.1 hypothetical protein DBR32_02505 [Taibaiella sp. KBW10]
MDQYSPYDINKPKKKKGVDNAVAGLLVGLGFSILGLVLVYFLMYNSVGLTFYLNLFKGEPTYSAASKPISLAMIVNLVPFYYFLNRKAYQSTKGVIIATVLLGLLFVLYKFIW